MDIAPILTAAFAKPGAILISRDVNNFRDEADISYEIGIQQPRQHKRFANVFRHGDDGALYFKHEPATVQQVYAEHPQSISPSEVSPKHWSRAVFLPRLPDEVYVELLTKSYQLVLDKVTKKGRALVEEVADQEMLFWRFHEIAMEYEAREGVSAHYTDDAFGGPAIRVGGKLVIRYEYNSLVCDCESHVLGDLDWTKRDGKTTVTADAGAANWDTATRRVLDHALKE